MTTIDLRHGDSLKRLKEIKSNSVAAVITDPPYDLTSGKTSKKGFMGAEWDGTGIAFNPAIWKEVWRVLKPGGVLKVLGGTRTFHKVARALEQAGFKDLGLEAWVYSSGFPKSHNISKAIDKIEGTTPEQVKAWEGYGTALKPAIEPILIAYKDAETDADSGIESNL